MATVALITSLAMIFVAIRIKHYRFSPQLLQPVTIAIFSLVISNTLLHLYVTQNMLHTTNLITIIFGISFFILPRRWFLTTLAISVISWALVVINFATQKELIHFSFSVFSSSLVAVIFHSMRTKTNRENQKLRLLSQLQHKKLEYQAMHDPLTGIANRRLFFKKLEKSLVKAQNNAQKIAVLYLDLNNFKPMNDENGHEYGDEILKNAALKLTSLFTEVDLVARVGGDEFSIIISNLESKNTLNEILLKVNNTFKKPVYIRNKKIQIGISIGYAIFPDDAKNPDKLMDHADMMMYQHKKMLKGDIY